MTQVESNAPIKENIYGCKMYIVTHAFDEVIVISDEYVCTIDNIVWGAKTWYHKNFVFFDKNKLANYIANHFKKDENIKLQ